MEEKNKRRLQQYRPIWEKDFPELRPVPGNVYKAKCLICKGIPGEGFSISHGGISDIKQHFSSAGHKQRQKAGMQANLMKNFFKENSSEADKITSCELALAYYAVKHHLSYASTDCCVKLQSQLFSDSAIARKVTCGKTKCEALVKRVLGPSSVENVTENLQEAGYFGIGFDASNKGNQKCFPITVRYFDNKLGVCNKIIDFYEDSDETAKTMSQQILSRITDSNLKLSQVSSFSADNTNANYGNKNSVYVHLKEKNPNLVKANCCAHIIHNACKSGMNAMSFDIEVLIIKLFNYFSSSAKRVSQLKEFFEFVDLEYNSLLRHVPTRWLSLKPAIERLLKNLPAVFSYFDSIDDCPSLKKT